MDAVTAISLPASVRDRVRAQLEYEPNDSVKGVVVDLNHDRRPDFIVQSARSLCGTGGCLYLVVDGAQGKVLGQLFGEPLYVLKKRSHGYPTIASYSHMSVASGSYTTWTFDGREYKQTGTRSVEGASLDSLFTILKRIPMWRPAPPALAAKACDTPGQRPTRQATGPLSAAERESLLAEARTRRATWQARHITSYRIRVAVGCFCPWPHEPRVLEVRGGKAVALLDSIGRQAGPLHEPWASYTVEGLFDYVEQNVQRVDVLAVQYDACLGYPTSIRGDAKVGRVDDWFWVTATELTPHR